MKHFLTLIVLFITLSSYGQVISPRTISNIETSRKLEFKIGTTDFKLELEEFVFPDFEITVDGQHYDHLEVKTYKDKNSLTLVRVKEDGSLYVQGWHNNKSVQIQGNKRYYGSAGPVPEQFCEWTEDLVAPIDTREIGDTSTCLYVHWNVSHTLYEAKGSNIDSAVQYMIDVWAVVAMLYAQEGVDLRIGDATFYTTPNPYPDYLPGSITGLNITCGLNLTDDLNGDLRHGVGVHPGVGGVAYLNGFGSSNPLTKCAFSSIHDNFISDFTQYSWTILVLAHEMGHSAGSNHTHRCSWGLNGDIRIDDCGPSVGYTELGDCESLDGLPEDGGTIMSYCHLTGVGINPALGFGTGDETTGEKPGDIVRQGFANWGTVCIEGQDCLNPFAIQVIATSTTAVISWVGYADSYLVSINGQPAVTTNQNSITVGGLIPFAENTVFIQSVCDGFNSIGAINTFFTPCEESTQADGFETNMEENNALNIGNANFEYVWDDSLQQMVYATNGNEPYSPSMNGRLVFGCFNTESTPLIVVNLGIIVETEISNEVWDWAELQYSYNGVDWNHIGNYPFFYNQEKGYNYDKPVWGSNGQIGEVFDPGIISQPMDVGSEETVYLAIKFYSDGLIHVGDGARIYHLSIESATGCVDPEPCDTIPYTDTTFVTIHDTLTTEVFDTSFVTVHDTIITEIFDTSFVTITDTVEIFDTTFITETVYDTVIILDPTCADTVYIECPPVDLCPCKGNKIKVCERGVTRCIPQSQFNPTTMELGPCDGQVCAGNTRTTPSIKLYPNPTTGVVRYEIPSSLWDSQILDYQVLDIRGKFIKSGVCFNRTSSIDLGSESQGVYIIKFYDGGELITESKIVLKH